MVFRSQLKSVLWKNVIVKSRHPVELLLEFCIPLLVLVGMWGIRLSINLRVTDAFLPAKSMYAPSIDEIFLNPECEVENLVWSCLESPSNCDTFSEESKSFVGCKLKVIAVAPKDGDDSESVDAARGFIDWANDAIDATNNVSLFEYFNSQKDFIDQISRSKYSQDDSSIYSVAVIFNGGHPGWDYTIRQNQSFHVEADDDPYSTPQTRIPAISISLETADEYPEDGSTWTMEPYLHSYLRTGVFALQDAVNSYIATVSCRIEGLCLSNETVTLHMDGAADFPNREIEEDIFWQQIGFVFALLMIMALLYPLANVIKTLVNEKETRVREGMMMMSLRGDVIWIGWVLFYMVCIFIPLSLFLTLVGRQIFVYSDMSYIFLYFLSFFMASLAYCILVSIVFSRAKTAAVAGCFVFFAGYFVYVGLQSTDSDRATLLLACLHPASAFTFGTLAFQEYEDAKIGITDNTWDVSQEYDISFLDTIIMQFVNTAYLLVLSWYLTQVWPSEYGVHKPWYFLFTPDYWRPLCVGICSIAGLSQRPVLARLPSYGDENERSGVEMAARNRAKSDPPCIPIEDVPNNLKSQVEDKKCVHIHNLRKSFHTNTGEKVAVDGLNMTFYSGQITALLGHNGAGKSTSIHMLTGLYPPDQGTATIEGYDIRQDMSEARKKLGVCPQHDVLQPDMTVEEHLYFFASIKGCPPEEIESDVTAMIDSVGLTSKRKDFAKNLSGGQKRKLSVAIAFIGKSRVVVLDEPTSGMDPYSRRATWNVISQHKEGRVIILVTHFMDEADLLGDRIAIMGDGKLLCCGSSLFLKRTYGVGYNMTIEKASTADFDSNRVIGTITDHVADAKVLTNVGTELTVQLPFTNAAGFQSLFELLDDTKTEMGIVSYGMSVTTLEEVFLKVASGTTTVNTAVEGMQHEGHDGEKYVPIKAQDVGNGGEGTMVRVAEKGEAVALGLDEDTTEKQTRAATDMEAQYSPVDSVVPIGKDEPIKLFSQHMRALLLKRLLYFRRDTKSWVFQFVLPVIFVLVGCIIMRFSDWAPSQPSIKISASDYNKKVSNNYLPFPYSNADFVCPVRSDCSEMLSQVSGQSMIMDAVDNANDLPVEPVDYAISIYNMSYFLLANRDEYRASRYGAVTFNNILYNDSSVNSGAISRVDYVTHANFTGVHAGPIYTNMLAEAVLHTVNSGASITLRMHPLPQTTKEKELFDNFNVSTVVNLISIALAFIPAAFAAFVVYEKETKCYHQQIVSGVSKLAYWLSTWLWDLATYQISAWLIILVLVVFPDTELLTGKGAIEATIALFMLFGPALCGFTYITCFLFKTAGNAQVITVFINFLLGLCLSVAGLVLRFIPTTHDVYMSSIRYIFVLFPQFALSDGLSNLSLIDFYSDVELRGGRKYDHLDWNITGLHLTVLGVEALGLIAALLLVDYILSRRDVHRILEANKDMPPGTGKDNDVIEMERKVLSGEVNSSTSQVLIKDIKKQYPGGNYAVRGVSLAIPNGECFGLLGVNGAGKSSLLNMLSGEFFPSEGDAELAGHSITTEMDQCRYHIGFCPQFDAIFDLLSGREHLNLYAAIKGVRPESINSEVNGKVSDLGLTEYIDRAAGGYSGGNKRKLSVAMAMVAEPSILFLDEPSTGMDPMARYILLI